MENLYECIKHVIISITTKNDKRPITIGSLYRAPNTNDSKFVEEYSCLLKDLYKKSKSKTLILGMDHNLDFLKHSSHKRTHDFIELNLDNNLLPTITRPTGITKMTATLIDNIIVSHSLMANSESRIIIDDISDHLPSLLKLKDTLQTDRYTKTVTSRKLDDKTLKKLNNSLISQNWASVITENVDESFTSFHKILQNTLDLHALIVTRKLNPKSYRRERWLKPSLLRCINKQKKLYFKTLKANATDTEITKYKNYKKVLDKLKRLAKIRYFHTRCSEYKGNVMKMWELINQVIGKMSDKSNVISYIKVNDIEILNEKAIANEFGKYFVNVGKDFANKVKNPKRLISFYNNKIDRNPKSIYFYKVTEEEVRKLIETLPNKASSGYDNINNILLKKLCSSIASPLSKIFNLSISKGVFPEKMKRAETSPLYKGKETYYTNNYRPISLLLTISNILEKVIYKRTYKFLNQTNQFYNSQYGFRNSHSCKDAVCELVGEVINKEASRLYAELLLCV